VEQLWRSAQRGKIRKNRSNGDTGRKKYTRSEDFIFVIAYNLDVHHGEAVSKQRESISTKKWGHNAGRVGMNVTRKKTSVRRGRVVCGKNSDKRDRIRRTTVVP